MKTFELRNACNQLVNELKTIGGQNNIIKLSIDIQLPDQYAGNPNEFFQIFKMLTGYYASVLVNGLITIEILLQSKHGSEVTVRVQVNGQGLLKEAEGDSKLLERVITRLGLAISRKSNAKEMSFEFPYQLKTLDREIVPHTLMFEGKKALIAEDNEINALVFASFLEEWGCKNVVVGNGLQAVAAVRNEPFDIVLMDIHMPELSGSHATQEIRKFNSVPIVALTASTQESDIRQMLDAGANDFLIKPVSSTHLFQVVCKYLT